MKNISYRKVELSDGYWRDKQELNKNVTIHAVYDRFSETGRIGAFRFDYKPEDERCPHFYWDSDVAKWIEGVAYILNKQSSPILEQRVEELIDLIEKNQCEDGYFNIYFTVVKPELRFTDRDMHELYCAGHLIEAAVAYAEATGRTRFLTCMEKYVDLIAKVFMQEHSAAFSTPGHEEIELALIRLYRYTGKKKYLELSEYFINARGVAKEPFMDAQIQSHLPVRQQRSVVGHSVRAMYLCAAIAALVKENGDEELFDTCRALWEDTTTRKMYVTGGVGSTNIGEAFTTPYDLPNDAAYTETCASIGLVLFANAMQELSLDSTYADVIERALYNGILSGLSASGDSFFYENPLEINRSERFSNCFGKRSLPLMQRPKMFNCSCCPPNLNRLIPSIGSYLFGKDEDTLYVHQYTGATLNDGPLQARMETNYPQSGSVRLCVRGVSRVALRIPGWCSRVKINLPYEMKNGYAVVENSGEILLEMDMTPRKVWADVQVIRDAGRVAIMRGPIVYCAESVDNGENLHRLSIPTDAEIRVCPSGSFGLPELQVDAVEHYRDSSALYNSTPPSARPFVLRMIPYNSFANRGECDMMVWFLTQ